MKTDIHTRFHIDLQWWANRGRNLRRFLAAILEDDDAAAVTSGPIDYIDPETAEVQQIDAVWARVVVERAKRADYITSATPLTNAVLRALIENLNKPMTPAQLHRRINRTSPGAILRVLQTARATYGIVPVEPNDGRAATSPTAAKTGGATKGTAAAKSPAKAKASPRATATASATSAAKSAKSTAKPKAKSSGKSPGKSAAKAAGGSARK